MKVLKKTEPTVEAKIAKGLKKLVLEELDETPVKVAPPPNTNISLEEILKDMGLNSTTEKPTENDDGDEEEMDDEPEMYVENKHLEGYVLAEFYEEELIPPILRIFGGFTTHAEATSFRDKHRMRGVVYFLNKPDSYKKWPSRKRPIHANPPTSYKTPTTLKL